MAGLLSSIGEGIGGLLGGLRSAVSNPDTWNAFSHFYGGGSGAQWSAMQQEKELNKRRAEFNQRMQQMGNVSNQDLLSMMATSGIPEYETFALQQKFAPQQQIEPLSSSQVINGQVVMPGSDGGFRSVPVADFMPEQERPSETSLMQNAVAAGLIPGSAEYQEFIRQGTMRPSTTVTVDNGIKVPTGFMVDPQNPSAVVPIPGGPNDPSSGQVRRDAEAEIDRQQNALATYESALDKYGVQVMPGPEKLAIQSAYNNLMLELKELYNLGVLNGPDLEIMTDIIAAPTSINTGLFYTGDDLKNQLNEVVKPKFQAAVKKFEEQYGRPYVPGQTTEQPSNSPIPGLVLPPGYRLEPVE